MSNDKILSLFNRLVDAVERLAPPAPADDRSLLAPMPSSGKRSAQELRPVAKVAAVSASIS